MLVGRNELDTLLGTVEDIMKPKVVVLRRDDLLGTAARELERAEVSGGPVLDGGEVVGMVTLRDLFEGGGLAFARVATSGPWLRFEDALDRTGRSVGEVMTASVVTLGPGTPVTEVALAMQENGVNRIPVVGRTRELKGIVTRDDVIAALARAARMPREWDVHPSASRLEPG